MAGSGPDLQLTTPGQRDSIRPMKLEDEVKAPTGSDILPQTEVDYPPEADAPMPNNLRFVMFGVLVVGVLGILVFGYSRQTSVKPPAVPTGSNCKDPVTENRLRETLKQSPNDFTTLVDWGSYNLSCEKNYAIAVAAYKQATILADDSATSTAEPAERNEAHFRLGLAYLYNLNYKEAQAQFELLVQEDPKNTSALLALSAALAKDDPAKAETYLTQLINIAPADSEIGKQAKSLLDDLKKRPAK